MQKLLSVAEMQTVECEAVKLGLSYAKMMENAGNNLALWVNREYYQCTPHSALGLVGSGNNGGDALVALCKLVELGWHTIGYVVKSRPEHDELTIRYLKMGGCIIAQEDDPSRQSLSQIIRRSSVLIDGVLGTGARLPLPDDIASILDHVRQEVRARSDEIHVVAVDCPSGVNCDNGRAAPETVPAEVTYTMAGIKHGMLMFPAADLVGDIQVGDIGDLTNVEAWKTVNRAVLTDSDIFPYLPIRPRDAHKGTFGTTLIIAGSVNYPGAALLAGEAAYRIGAGLVTLAVPETIYAASVGVLREVTWLCLPDTRGWINQEAARIVESALQKVSSILIGPGLGLQASTSEFVEKLIKAELPAAIIDADGLKLLAKVPDWYSIHSGRMILTPHPGEMAILTGLTKEDIQANRIEIAEQYARLWNKVLVLKGAYTVIAEPADGRSVVVPYATPALARAGTGDVLAGIIAGLLAQGIEPFMAAYLGAYLHAAAGVKAETQLGTSASVIAGDVIRMIPEILSSYR